jgi:hypothetical protein
MALAFYSLISSWANVPEKLHMIQLSFHEIVMFQNGLSGPGKLHTDRPYNTMRLKHLVSAL